MRHLVVVRHPNGRSQTSDPLSSPQSRLHWTNGVGAAATLLGFQGSRRLAAARDERHRASYLLHAVLLDHVVHWERLLKRRAPCRRRAQSRNRPGASFEEPVSGWKVADVRPLCKTLTPRDRTLSPHASPSSQEVLTDASCRWVRCLHRCEFSPDRCPSCPTPPPRCEPARRPSSAESLPELRCR